MHEPGLDIGPQDSALPKSWFVPSRMLVNQAMFIRASIMKHLSVRKDSGSSSPESFVADIAELVLA